jgi:hypothetical protein
MTARLLCSALGAGFAVTICGAMGLSLMATLTAAAVAALYTFGTTGIFR